MEYMKNFCFSAFFCLKHIFAVNVKKELKFGNWPWLFRQEFAASLGTGGKQADGTEKLAFLSEGGKHREIFGAVLWLLSRRYGFLKVLAAG